MNVKQETVNTRQIALIAIMSALVLALTYIRPFNTPVGGYIHLGDIMIYFTALAFGPVIGGVAGGVGTALADLVGGFPLFAISSLVVHGLQGYIAGKIGHGKTDRVTLSLAVVAGSAIVVSGYFIAEAVFLGWGAGAAAAEIPWNIIQEIVGAIGVLVYLYVRRAYPPLTRYSK
jgi:uncharacterized membrane protein